MYLKTLAFHENEAPGKFEKKRAEAREEKPTSHKLCIPTARYNSPAQRVGNYSNILEYKTRVAPDETFSNLILWNRFRLIGTIGYRLIF